MDMPNRSYEYAVLGSSQRDQARRIALSSMFLFINLRKDYRELKDTFNYSESIDDELSDSIRYYRKLVKEFS